MSSQPEPLDITSSTPVVFLSGAGLPSWIWDDVRAALPASVETVVADRPHHADAALSEHADAAAAQAPWPTFAIVAHSIGGVVAAELLARHPGRVSGILGVSALVPSAGRSFVNTMPLPTRALLSVVLRLAATRPPAKAIRAGLASQLPEAIMDRIVAEFAPESPRLYRDVTSVRDLPPVRAYLCATQDKEFSPALQRRSAEVLQSGWVEDLSTGHLPMLQDPLAVVHAVEKFLAEINE